MLQEAIRQRDLSMKQDFLWEQGWQGLTEHTLSCCDSVNRNQGAQAEVLGEVLVTEGIFSGRHQLAERLCLPPWRL